MLRLTCLLAQSPFPLGRGAGTDELERSLPLAHLARPVLDDIQLNPLARWHADARLALAIADHEDVLHLRCEDVLLAVLNADDVEGARVPLTVRYHAHTALILSATDHHQSAGLELDLVFDGSRLQVHHHRVVSLDVRVRKAQRPAVVRNGLR